MLKRRLYPAHLKEPTQSLAIKEMGPPEEVVMPLLQHTGVSAQALVSLKGKVKVGTLIAQAKEYLSSPIHSSISGEVKAIQTRPHSVLGQYQAIVIASDGQDSLEPSIKNRENADSLSAEEIKKIIHQAGIVGLGGAGFPTHVKLNPPKDKPIDTFILNGAECEPYLTADHRLMLEKAKEIISGAKIIMKVLGVSSGIAAIEENKPDAISLLQKLTDKSQIKVVTLKSFYPQGAEKQLIKTILRREVPSGGLPFDVGVVVNNVATSFAIYEAVYQNKPLYERVITVTGKTVKNPSNLKVRLGTKAEDILKFCGGLTEEPAKIIFGGPMMGIAQYTLQVPVIKSTTGILVLNRKESTLAEENSCIRCGACVRNCPLGLAPCLINLAAEKEMWPAAKKYGALDCIECGLCAYLCPANRRIIQSVKRAKLEIKR